MKILAFQSKNNLEDYAARLILKTVEKNAKAVLGLATGRTMVGVYDKLVHRAQNSGLTFREVRTFNLDEYVGLPKDHAGSFETYMRDHLFSHLDFNPALCSLPRGNALNLEAEALRYESEIDKAGGIDFQLLGLGLNAHIGFNEPGSSFSSKTRVVDLSRSTKEQNQSSFGEEKMPDQAISVGLSTIMRSKKILLIVTGKAKSEVLKNCLESISEELPASLLQKHSDVTILVDEEAMSAFSEERRKTVTYADNMLF